jgi:myo-inositol-1(or 4)-monophosphatase
LREHDLDALLTEVRRIVSAAGAVIEEIRASGQIQTQSKEDASPVTRADRAADELLRSQLPEAFPAAWLSEETVDDAARLEADRLWVVDPLDGTREFVEGLPEYSVAVALVMAGRPILGVVHNPATGDMYWAAHGGGAFHNGTTIRVAEGDALLTSRSETRRGEFTPFEEHWLLKPIGSIELKLALVAAGTAALTLSRGPKHEWDVCAGSLIVREAGGLATDMFGDDLTFNRPFPKVKGILAGAPQAYARGLEQLLVIGASDRMDEFADLRPPNTER